MITQEQRDAAAALAVKLEDEGRTTDAELIQSLLDATANSGYDDSAKAAEVPQFGTRPTSIGS